MQTPRRHKRWPTGRACAASSAGRTHSSRYVFRGSIRRFNSLKRLCGFILLLFERLLWRERGDDFLEARIATERVPKRQEFQLTVADRARAIAHTGKLLTGEAFVAYPGSNYRQILDYLHAADRVLFHRKKLNCARAFAKRFLFSPQTCVNQAKYAQSGTVIGLTLEDFLLL